LGNVSQKSYRKPKLAFYIQQLLPQKNLAAYEIMWKNMVEPDRPQMIIK
jgi:hypothetical protein